ncbi:peroxisomal sarcosine oxidase-like isoform X2 [Penaeus japonicus]|uniref:peroxisomal sarcosine oxidase-like isoform X2 n=1 Tax=Penaeus japonicus TaxID=27405 RepID=UPI001C71684C|nr:peroxisomal sarcosine oxidase-like isoform X2 [Penaeus japonicus]
MSEILEADVVVVGAGVHGSSAALHLARAGKKTILLEQFTVPHSRGSSHGQTRIIRQTNFGTPALAPLLEDSYKQWKAIQAQAGDVLLRPSPLLVLGTKEKQPLMEQMAESVRESGHVPQWLAPAHVNNMFGLECGGDAMAFLDPSGGVLMADKCVGALQRLFRAAGGMLLDGWPVAEIKVEPEGSVEVRGQRGKVRAASLVLCPGPWAAPLLGKIGLHLPVRVERISVLYWRVKDSRRTTTTSFVDVSDDRGHFYGLPDIEYPGLVKVCFHGGPEVHPDQRDKCDGREIRERVMQYVQKKFPCLEPQPVIEESCMYTEPDSRSGRLWEGF